MTGGETGCMIRGVQFCGISAAAVLAVILVLSSCLYAADLTINGSSQMSVSTSQTLTAEGGCGVPNDYVWTIAGGGGSFTGSTRTTTGASAVYTAPPSNPYCASNAKIVISDACGFGSIQIAVNGITSGSNFHCAAVKAQVFTHQDGPDYYSQNCCKTALKCDGTGDAGGFCGFFITSPYCGDWYQVYHTINVGCGYLPDASPPAVCCAQSPVGTPGEGIFDTRVEAQKASGCCPAGLPPEPDKESNCKGNTCPQNSLPIGSSANFKSGNLYHSQDVGKLTLSYNSIDTIDGSLGKKWTHNYNRKLTGLSDNQTITLIMDDGNLFYYRLSGGIFYPEAITGDTSQIVKNANGTYTQTTKLGTVYQYDTTGKLTGITDRNSRTTTLTYSGTDLSSITDFNGRTTTITNTSGLITGITDPMGRTHTIGYTSGYITSITDPLNNAWQFSYDADGYMLIKSDPLNRNVNYTYDTSGRVLTATGPDGKVKAMTYNQTGTTTHTEEDGGVWTYKYDPTFTVKTEVTDPKGYTVKYAYDNKRNVIKKTEHDGSYTSYTYDNNGNRLTITDPLGKTTTYTYNALNLVSSVTDPKNNTTQYGYDTNGNLTSITAPGNAVTTYQYDTRGNITSITTPNNKTTTMTYDSKNNLISVTDPKNGTVTMTYDNNGNMLTQTDALNNTTSFQYNNLNQLTQITDPKSYVTQYTYDYNGNRLSSTDANSTTTNYLYNYKDQLTQITDALNNVTGLSYGGTGCSSCGTGGGDKLTALTDAKNNTTSFTYDQTGKLTSETDPLGKITSYGYDGKGNLISRTSPDNKTITYNYDLNNRLTGKSYSDSSAAAFQYDDNGNITYAGNQYIAYNFTYDSNNRITVITDSNSRTITYAYDSAGNRISMTTPDNKTITYGYDNNNLPNQITTDLGSFTFTYDANNRRLTRTMPNGTTSTYSYDEDSRLTGINTTKSAKTIDSAAYTHDYAGNRLTKTTPQETWSYGYDSIYRLTQAAPTGGIHQSEAYTYDQVGNRLSKTNETPPTDNETINYTYDDENRLTKVVITKNSKQKELTFTYDPFGRRITKTLTKDEIGTDCTAPNTCPRTTTYVYDNQNIIAEYNTNGEVQTRYTHGPNIDEPLAIEIKAATTFTPYFYHADGLGSITSLSSASGTVVQRYAYDTFGNMTITANGNISQPYTYTSREYDTETGMYFYRARYYDPKVGRFVTKDPIGFGGGINVYAYVGNSPINLSDPYGLFHDGVRDYYGDERNYLTGGYPELGHSDFYGGKYFDYTLEDKGSTGPWRQTWRHFRNLPEVEADLEKDLQKCYIDGFQRHMHQGQDYFVHYRNGFKYWHSPIPDYDNDRNSWSDAQLWTIKWVKRWKDRKCKYCEN